MSEITALRTITGTTRKGRLARLFTATAFAGVLAAGVVAAAAPANAATITNPACPVPTTVVFTATHSGFVPASDIFFTDWQATYNGVLYDGFTEAVRHLARIAPNLLPANGESGYCYPA